MTLPRRIAAFISLLLRRPPRPALVALIIGAVGVLLRWRRGVRAQLLLERRQFFGDLRVMNMLGATEEERVESELGYDEDPSSSSSDGSDGGSGDGSSASESDSGVGDRCVVGETDVAAALPSIARRRRRMPRRYSNFGVDYMKDVEQEQEQAQSQGQGKDQERSISASVLSCTNFVGCLDGTDADMEFASLFR